MCYQNVDYSFSINSLFVLTKCQSALLANCRAPNHLNLSIS